MESQNSTHKSLLPINALDSATARPTASHSGTGEVRAFYERHTYPRYPLLALPKWQEGLYTSSLFAARLAQSVTGHAAASLTSSAPHTIVLGAGDMLPYVIRKWESPHTRVSCIDLSRNSLWRARTRLWRQAKRNYSLHADDLTHWLNAQPEESATHVDAYGVLHHLADPESAVAAMSRALTIHGTARVMVYNQQARAWIRTLQQVFRIAGLSPLRRHDMTRARTFLTQARALLPRLDYYLHLIGPQTLTNDARFADTFMHPLESSWSIAQWLDCFARHGLKPIGMLDRYGELDDLPAPATQMPTAEALTTRARDGRFENNVECWLVRTDQNVEPASVPAAYPPPHAHVPMSTLGYHVPSSWWQFSETRNASHSQRRLVDTVMHHWLQSGDVPVQLMTRVQTDCPLPLRQRISRLGMPLITEVSPMFDTMECPTLPPQGTFTDAQRTSLVATLSPQVAEATAIRDLFFSAF